ncbi:MAG: hypothetical protein N4A46_06345 [Schleiferiaceae bacterium]|jgi:hypothetical protein|nr:hypothetical protein [Schleiferiaceae bacterium]
MKTQPNDSQVQSTHPTHEKSLKNATNDKMLKDIEKVLKAHNKK